MSKTFFKPQIDFLNYLMISESLVCVTILTHDQMKSELLILKNQKEGEITIDVISSFRVRTEKNNMLADS